MLCKGLETPLVCFTHALGCISGKLQEVRDNLLLVLFSSFSGNLFHLQVF